MRLLVTGAAGMLGRDVVAAAESAGHDVTGLARRDLDIADPDAVRAAVRAARPDAVVNCAAWTDVDGAEEHEADATLINGDGRRARRRRGALRRARVLRLRLRRHAPPSRTREDDPTGPAGAYGRSKLAGELAVAAAGRPRDRALLLAVRRPRPELRRHHAAAGRGPRRGQRRRRPDRLPDLHRPPRARARRDRRAAADGRRCTSRAAAGARGTSWRRRRSTRRASTARAVPVTTAEFPRPAPRPAWSVLRSTRPDAPVLPPWREGLSAYLRSEVLQ